MDNILSPGFFDKYFFKSCKDIKSNSASSEDDDNSDYIQLTFDDIDI